MNNNDANTTTNGKKIEVTIGSLLYSDKVLINLEDGYEIKDENGQLYAVKKKEYPKTYEECINELDTHKVVAACAWEKEMKALQTLLICRDAYWKIAGEEMGLGKPWEYDMSNDEFSYAISYQYGYIQKNEIRHKNAIFAFPTKEMRDAFYENFKIDIENCKDLL